MKTTSMKSISIALVAVVVLAALGLAAFLAKDRLSRLHQVGEVQPSAGGHEHEGESGHSHDHAGHDEGNSLELSAQARSSIGLELVKIELQSFEKTISVPGIVTERPGRTVIQVTAPMTGVITKLEAVQGQAVKPGQPLAQIRLTHEELVQAQGDLLQTAESLDVVKREITRVEALAREGAIPGKTLIDLNYERQKSEAILRAQRQTLVLHGLSEEQVEDILERRKLLSTLSVDTPQLPVSKGSASSSESTQPVLQVQELRVEQGQHVTAGDVLFVLADHRELFIEGRAFEQDVDATSKAVAEGWKVSAIVDSRSSKPDDVISNLSVVYLANRVDPDSRAFRFYVSLPNLVLHESQGSNGHYLDWEFKPGQRVQVRIPVEQWKDQIVLPIAAVASEGTENFVFQANGDHFDRRPVHVEYRDQTWAVIANDGSLFPGDMVAKSGAFQLQTALKNKAGGGIDPHAGHNH